ncbi:MAG: 4-hydroxybenzoate octaprenyltransferase [Pseudomonadota bacterium]
MTTPLIPDAGPTNWVDTLAPEPLRPYLRLARLDRPIGTWLLLWPCLWSLVLANVAAPQSLANGLWLGLLFLIGSVAMRGAGCTYNDIVDRDIDAQVARTMLRPLPSGQLSTGAAVGFLVAQSLVGLCVLLMLNDFAIALGIASLALVAAYPFMKRITWWPQAWLGLTFNWGALMGWAAVTGELGLPALLLYAAGIAWTLGYDTIYAHQDKDDDALIGVKSSALRLGEGTMPALKGFYGTAVLLIGLAAIAVGANPLFLVGLFAVGLHLAWQIHRLDTDDPDRCLALFKSNREAGALVLITLCLGLVPAGP